MRTGIASLALWVTAAAASYHGNLNYRSPSLSLDHAGLGIDLAKVEKRMLQKRDVVVDPETLNFTHGVASGDPAPDSIILWTRVAPSMESDTSNITVEGTAAYMSRERERYIKASSSPICVDWRVSSDPEPFSCHRPVASGRAYTTSDIDFTVKVEADGLEPFTTYWYQFAVCGTAIKSVVGRTKTAPRPEDDVSSIGLAVFSCANWPLGYFNAYGNAARKDAVDYFVHLGDYIYEDEHGVSGQDERAMIPARETITLHDYRTRHGQYRTDPDLLLAHQMFPWIPVWDDHDLINNGWRDGGSSINNTEASFLQQGGVSFDQRKMNAVRAYFEWVPLRQADLDDNLRIWRSFRLGSLVDLTMLDTRHYDRSITRVGANEAYVQRLANDAGRSMLGSHQENWFFRQLSESHARGTTWRVVGNQMIFSRMNMTASTNRIGGFDVDAWDGYLATRNRTLERIYEEGIGNVIMLAGDSHQNWVSDLAWLGAQPYDGATGKGAVGVEFAVTAVSSDGLDGTTHEAEAISRAFLEDNEELQWQEGYYRGYLELRFGRERLNAAFYGCPTVRDRNALDLPVANFTVFAGENHLARPVGGGRVEAGALRGGEVRHSNVSLDTEKGEWVFASFEDMFIPWGDEW